MDTQMKKLTCNVKLIGMPVKQKAAKREATATALLVVGEPTEDAIEAAIKREKAASRERVPAIPGKSPAAALSV